MCKTMFFIDTKLDVFDRLFDYLSYLPKLVQSILISIEEVMTHLPLGFIVLSLRPNFSFD